MITSELNKTGLGPMYKWIDFNNKKPKENDTIIIAFYEEGKSRRYAPISWTKDFNKDNKIIITHWALMTNVYKQNFPTYIKD